MRQSRRGSPHQQCARRAPVGCAVPFQDLTSRPAEIPAMPTYQYRCQTCQVEFEARQSFTDDALTTCIADACTGPVSKVFSGVGISFKGDGFYKNDHGSAAKDRTAEKSTSTTDTSDSGNSTSEKSTPGSSDSGSSTKSSGEGSSSSNGTSSNGTGGDSGSTSSTPKASSSA